jgi:hypothetical protein
MYVCTPSTPVIQWIDANRTCPTTAGEPNDYDYDYGRFKDYGGNYPDVGGGTNMNLVVSWAWNGVTRQIGQFNSRPYDSYTYGNFISPVHSGLHRRMFEIVYFQTGVAPPPTTYHICARWNFTETPSMKLVATVYKGYAVAVTTKDLNTSAPQQHVYSDYDYGYGHGGRGQPCSPNTYGYVMSYTWTTGSTPPLPSASSLSPPPPPFSYPTSYNLILRTDWDVLGGALGKQEQGNSVVYVCTCVY